MTKEFLSALSKPFPISEVSIRMGAKSKDGESASVFIYVEVPTIENRLDEACAQFDADWETSKQIISTTEKSVVVKCALTISQGDKRVTREDFGEETVSKEGATEIFKSASSDSFKRAARAFGVGRYLQSAPYFIAKLNDKGRFAKKEEDIISELYRRMNLTF
jgi:hypothetical protein